MRLVNRTKLDTEWLRAMVKAVTPSGVTNFDIQFSDTKRGNRARAYPAGSGYHSRAVPFTNIRLDFKGPYPEKQKAHGGYLASTYLNPYEAAVHLTAHELRHLWQRKVPRGRRVWGARGQYSERDADAYAIQMVRCYRRGELACGNGRMVPTPTPEDRVAKRTAAAEKRKAARAAHVRAQVAKWQRKAKLAKTMLRKWEAKLKRIEKATT